MINIECTHIINGKNVLDKLSVIISKQGIVEFWEAFVKEILTKKRTTSKGSIDFVKESSWITYTQVLTYNFLCLNSYDGHVWVAL